MRDYRRKGYHKCKEMPLDNHIELQCKNWHEHLEGRHSNTLDLTEPKCPYCGKDLSMFIFTEVKSNLSEGCDLEDNGSNPCNNCTYFVFPIGCMKGEEK